MQAQATKPLQTAQTPKKAYHNPDLRVYGDVKQLTLTSLPGTGADGTGLYTAS